MSEKNNIIGTNLRAFAVESFGSVAELAHSLKIKPQSLHKYLTGERQPGAEMIAKLIGIGCDANWLLTGKKTDFEKNEIMAIKREMEQIRQKNLKLSRKIGDFQIQFEELTQLIAYLDERIKKM